MELQFKPWFSVVINVFVADYALVVGANNVIIWVMGTWQKSKDKNGIVWLVQKLMSRKPLRRMFGDSDRSRRF